MNKAITFAVLALLAPYPAHAQNIDATTSVRTAILDFVEGCYDGDTERVARAFHPNLDKGGFWQRPDGTVSSGTHSYHEIIEECRTLYTERVQLPDEPKMDITIFEILDLTASAKLTAEWGTDFFHLAKYDGHWLIKNSLGEAHRAE